MMQRAHRLSAREIAEALGGKREANGRYTCRCPAHDDRTPSLSVWDDADGRVAVHCFASCSYEAVTDALRAKGLWPERSEKAKGNKPKLSTAEQAREMFERARPLDPNVAHPYFLARGIDTRRFPDLGKTLRLLDAARHPDSGTVGPAIIAAVINNDGFVCGIQRIFLTTDQSAKRPVVKPKMSLGSVKGRAIRLGPQSGTVLVAEGIEDAMTGALAMNMAHGVFAVTGGKMMPSLILPAYAEDVIVLSDNDAPGRQCTAKSARAFKGQGRSLSVAYPPEEVKDFNELVKGKTGAELEAGYEAVRARIEDAGDAIEPTAPILPVTEGNPTVQIAKGQLAKITSQIQDLLIGTGLYQRGGKIVRPGFVKAVDRKGRDILIPGIVTLDAHQLRLHISKQINCVSWNDRAKDLVPVDYSLEHTNALLTLGDQLAFPLLKAVVTTPVVFIDGRVLQTPGYDAASRLYYAPLGVDFPKIPERPSKDDALGALDDLKQPLREYPFKVREDETGDLNIARSVALSYFITIIDRAAFSVVPGHSVSGNNPGVGKGKLIAIGSILATGTTPAVVKQGEKDEEFEKNLATRMLSGATHIAIDNVDRVLKGQLLDQCITEDTIHIRTFGRLDGANVPNTYTTTATGQKLVFSGDAIRRWLQCEIETPYERPELAVFTFDPLEEARDKRAQLVVAALTVIRAYIAAGRPQKPTPLGSFEDWSDTVRGALIWLGEPDPAGSIETIRANDPKKNLEIRFLELWTKTFNTETRTVAELLKEIKPAHEYDPKPPPDHAMREIIIEAIGNDHDSRKLAWFLRKLADKTIGGKILRAAGSTQHAVNWKVDAVESVTKIPQPVSHMS
jgi:hypothetical protein